MQLEMISRFMEVHVLFSCVSFACGCQSVCRSSSSTQSGVTQSCGSSPHTYSSSGLRIAGYSALGPLLLFPLCSVPSECWPVRVSKDPACAYGPAQATHSELHVFDDKVVLCLKSRKNIPLGSRLTRHCWCGASPLTCPVHVLGDFFGHALHSAHHARAHISRVLLQILTRRFSAFRRHHQQKWTQGHEAYFCASIGIPPPSPCAFGRRRFLSLFGVQDAPAFDTKATRRGHTQDLVDSGAPLAEILLAGQWRSRAFHCYVDDAKLESSAVMSAHMDDSSDDDEWGLGGECDEFPLSFPAGAGGG